MKKCVAFLTNGLYPCVTGGVEIFHYNFIKALAKKTQVIALTLCDKSFQGEGISVCSTKSPVGRLQTLFTIYFHTKWLIKKRRDIGLIYIPYASQIAFQYYHAIALAQLFRIPYVLRISAGKMGAARPDFLHEWMFRHSSSRIAVSEPLKLEYEKRYGYPVEVLPSYLPFTRTSSSKREIRKKLRISQDELVLLFLGTVKSIKGPDVLIDALCFLGSDYLGSNKVKCLFVGGNDFSKSEDMISALEWRAETCGVSEYVRFVGKVKYEGVHVYYRASDIFIIPSVFEARPLSLAEAIYNGLPSIGSDIPTISNTIRDGENGAVFEQGNSQDLANKIRELVDNPEVLEKYASECARESASFDNFQRMVERYYQIFDQLMR